MSERTCWVGYLAGRAIPARPSPRQAVGVALRTTAGDRPAPSTPVTLTLRRRTGIPGVTADRSPGRRRWAGAHAGPLARVRVRIPAGINPDALWLVAQAAGDARPGSPSIDLRGPAVIEGAREVAAVAAAVGVVGLLAPLPALRSEAQRAGALAVMIVAWGILLRRAWCPGDDARSAARPARLARAGRARRPSP